MLYQGDLSNDKHCFYSRLVCSFYKFHRRQLYEQVFFHFLGKDPLFGNDFLSPYQRDLCEKEPRKYVKMKFYHYALLKPPVLYSTEIVHMPVGKFLIYLMYSCLLT